MLPDADVIGFWLGVRYEDPWGHRARHIHSQVTRGLMLLWLPAVWLVASTDRVRDATVAEKTVPPATRLLSRRNGRHGGAAAMGVLDGLRMDDLDCAPKRHLVLIETSSRCPLATPCEFLHRSTRTCNQRTGSASGSTRTRKRR